MQISKELFANDMDAGVDTKENLQHNLNDLWNKYIGDEINDKAK